MAANCRQIQHGEQSEEPACREHRIAEDSCGEIGHSGYAHITHENPLAFGALEASVSTNITICNKSPFDKAHPQDYC